MPNNTPDPASELARLDETRSLLAQLLQLATQREAALAAQTEGLRVPPKASDAGEGSSLLLSSAMEGQPNFLASSSLLGPPPGTQVLDARTEERFQRLAQARSHTHARARARTTHPARNYTPTPSRAARRGDRAPRGACCRRAHQRWQLVGRPALRRGRAAATARPRGPPVPRAERRGLGAGGGAAWRGGRRAARGGRRRARLPAARGQRSLPPLPLAARTQADAAGAPAGSAPTPTLILFLSLSLSLSLSLTPTPTLTLTLTPPPTLTSALTPTLTPALTPALILALALALTLTLTRRRGSTRARGRCRAPR